MPIVVVTSQQPGEGKTGVAVAIARHFAYLGRPVTLTRIAGEGANAGLDASYFASLSFVPGGPVGVAAPGDVSDPGGDRIAVVEADSASAASIAGASIVLAARHSAPKAAPAGLSPIATVVTDVSGLKGVRTNGNIVELGEDRTLAGFSVDDAKAALNAEILVPGDWENTRTCDHLVIAPIASDAGQPYFRRFDTKAVVVRFDKTDQHLAAMRGDPEFLILTGGRMPMGYLFDAASANGVPVLLSRTDTENTVIALEGIFDHTRFHGERKLERMAELLEGSPLLESLGL
ncbi:MAG: hypothetical protein LC118_00725 [Dehalococcoidia bacterium]|nr:hypothetical protein [Dehalococcoidia bacterium]